MTTSPEARNLFNESMLTGELKDMYQHYLLLKETNQVDEANKLYISQRGRRKIFVRRLSLSDRAANCLGS